MRTSAIISAFLIFLLLDSSYLYLNYKYFETQIINIQRVTMTTKPLGILATYLVLLFAYYYFILRVRGSPLDATILGLVIYGVYDLTNYSTFKKWELQTVIMDGLWGGVLFGLPTYIVYNIYGYSLDM